jgi:hypothetical protein
VVEPCLFQLQSVRGRVGSTQGQPWLRPPRTNKGWQHRTMHKNTARPPPFPRCSPLFRRTETFSLQTFFSLALELCPSFHFRPSLTEDSYLTLRHSFSHRKLA